MLMFFKLSTLQRSSIIRNFSSSGILSSRQILSEKLKIDEFDGKNESVKSQPQKKSRNIATVSLQNDFPQIASTIVSATVHPITIIKPDNVSKQLVLWEPTPSKELSNLFNNYLMLSKIRLTTLVVLTSMIGYAMAPGSFALGSFLMCTAGTGLCSAAANAINQYHEVPFDAQMSRTKNRVLVRGRVTPLHAINFAAASSALGIGLLYFGVNGYTAALGATNLLLYTSIYTPMKRVSILNTWIGSIVGAIPPMMGWVGCNGTLDIGCFFLAGILYSWQFPHFNALSWNLRPDYSRAGYRMMAVSHPALCRRVALRHTVALSALSIAAPLFDVTNVWFALESIPLNGYFFYLAYKFYQHSDSSSSRKLFRYSLIHLPALMILLLLNKKSKKTEDEAISIATSVNSTIENKLLLSSK